MVPLIMPFLLSVVYAMNLKRKYATDKIFFLYLRLIKPENETYFNPTRPSFLFLYGSAE
jgi:hypothetical protein